LNLYHHHEPEGGGTTQEEFIQWGEVVEDCGIRHPGDMERKASREDAKGAKGAEKEGLSVTVIESPSSEPVQRCPHFPFLSSSAPQREITAAWIRLRCCGGSGPFGFGLSGGHNRDAVGSRFGIRPRVGLVPRPTLGLGSQRRWRWQGQEPNGVNRLPAPSAISASLRETTPCLLRVFASSLEVSAHGRLACLSPRWGWGSL
jgi:hypothetical protein